MNLSSLLLSALLAVTSSLSAVAGGPAVAPRPGHLAELLARVNQIEGSEPQEALRLAKEGLALARQRGESEPEAAFLTAVAFASSQTGNLMQAVQYGNEGLALSTRLGNRERMAKAHNILGITYTFMGSYSRALDEGLEALRIREELGLEAASLQSLNLIGVIYHHSGQCQKAIEYYQKILDQSKASPASPRVILANLNIGFAQDKLGQYPQALQHLLLALELSRNTPEHPYLDYAYLNLGLTYTDLGNYPEAGKYLDLALAGYRSQDQKHGRIQVLNGKSRLAQLGGRFDQGIQLALEAAALAEQIHARDELKTSYELLSGLYEQKRDPGRALTYFKLYSTTKDSIFTSQESERIADISMKIVTLKKDHEIESLRKEHTIASLNLQKERYFSFLLVFGLVTLFLFVLVLIGYGKKTRDSKLALEKANSSLQALNAELQETISEVKNLSGLLPICAKCKKIRDDDGYWQQLEGYISKHTSATFSHGICPHCAEELYPDMIESLREQGGEGWHSCSKKPEA